MADPEVPATLAVVNEQFFPNLTENQLRERIAETENVLRTAFAEAACAKASLAIFYFPKALHFSIVRADDRNLFLSVYEQSRSPVIRSSVFHLDLVKDPPLEEYWDETILNFIVSSRSA